MKFVKMLLTPPISAISVMLALSASAANRFVSNDGTWKMKDESGQEMTGTCYTSLKSALGNGHVIYVKNDYDCTGDMPDSGARYQFGGGYSSCIIRSESGDWRTGPTLSGRHDWETETGIGTNAFRVFWKTGLNSYGIQIIGFKILDGAATLASDKADGYGGCVRGYGAAGRITLKNCLVSGGAAYSGGGAYMCRLENCIVTNNYAHGNGGGLDSSSYVIDTLVSGNSARKSGGGASSGTFSNCVVSCNISGLGGGMEGGALSSVNAYGCTITNNTNFAESGGGCKSCNTYNCLITHNAVVSGTSSTVGRGGGGVLYGSHYNDLIANNICGCYGSGAMAAALYNCTIVNNVGTNAGGHTAVIATCQNGNSYLNNCIVWGNRNLAGGKVSCDATAASNSCLEVTSILAKWVSCTNVNPQLDAALRPHARVCKRAGLVFEWMTDEADVRSKDLAGNPRIAPGKEKPDMGCYETPFTGLMMIVR